MADHKALCIVQIYSQEDKNRKKKTQKGRKRKKKKVREKKRGNYLINSD